MKFIEKGLRHVFITSSSSRFFKITDFKQYHFKAMARVDNKSYCLKQRGTNDSATYQNFQKNKENACDT